MTDIVICQNKYFPTGYIDTGGPAGCATGKHLVRGWVTCALGKVSQPSPAVS